MWPGGESKLRWLVTPAATVDGPGTGSFFGPLRAGKCACPLPAREGQSHFRGAGRENRDSPCERLPPAGLIGVRPGAVFHLPQQGYPVCVEDDDLDDFDEEDFDDDFDDDFEEEYEDELDDDLAELDADEDEEEAEPEEVAAEGVSEDADDFPVEDEEFPVDEEDLDADDFDE